MKKILTLGVFALVALPLFASAGPIIRSGETISIDATQSLEGDFYGLAPEVSISGSAKDDVYVAGGSVTINAPVAHDLSIIAGSVQVHGEVGDDLRVVGGEVVLGTPVKGDVVVFAGTLKILSTASVEGDVIFWGKEISIEGPVTGTIHGSSESIRINAAVGGDIEYTSDAFVLGDKANVTGNITYVSDTDMVRAQGAVVTGEIHRTDSLVTNEVNPLQTFMLVGLTILFSTLAFYFVARGVTERIVRKSETNIGMYGLIGLGALVTLPIIIFVLMLSVVGGVVGVVLLFAYIGSIISALIFGIIMLGHLVQRAVIKKAEFSVVTPAVGALIAFGVLLIPIVGGFILLASTLIAMGVFGHTLYHTLRN